MRFLDNSFRWRVAESKKDLQTPAKVNYLKVGEIKKQTNMKSFLKSKTLWFNFLTLALMVAGNFGFKEFIPSLWVNDAGISLILIVNIILRFITKQPIALKSK